MLKQVFCGTTDGLYGLFFAFRWLPQVTQAMFLSTTVMMSVAVKEKQSLKSSHAIKVLILQFGCSFYLKTNQVTCFQIPACYRHTFQRTNGSECLHC